MSSKEDIAFRKMSMLMKAVTEANEQDDTLEELKAAAFEVLRLNPGCEQSDWAKILVEQYGTEVVDAYGKDPAEAYASLEDLWKVYTSMRLADWNTTSRHGQRLLQQMQQSRCITT